MSAIAYNGAIEAILNVVHKEAQEARNARSVLSLSFSEGAPRNTEPFAFDDVKERFVLMANSQPFYDFMFKKIEKLTESVQMKID